MKTKNDLNHQNFSGKKNAESSDLGRQGRRDQRSSRITPESEHIARQKVRIRHSIASPDAAARRNVAYLKKAVAKMKEISKTSPESKTGWIAQAEIHYKYCTGNHDIHDNGLFVPWHRAYLFFFEEICRRLLKEDNVADYDDFALPYWDWSKSPNVPDVFGETVWDEDLNTVEPPAGWIKDPNFKWERRIKPKGQLLGDLQINHILKASSIYPIVGVKSFGTSGGGLLMMGPHSIVHGEIGGNMGDSAAAALDPLFFIHHANIDRIWSKWMEDHPDKTPSPNCPPEGCGINCRYPLPITNWLKEAAEGFYDVDGAPTSRRVLNLLDTFNPAYLGYDYDDGAPINWSDCPQVRPLDRRGYWIKSKVIGTVVRASESKTVRVGDVLDAPAGFKVIKNLNVAVHEILQSQIDSEAFSPSSSLLLTIEVEKPANPAISVRVFINAPPDKSQLSIESPSYVATFSFFESAGHPHHHGHDGMNMKPQSRGVILDITNTILKLSESKDSKPFDLEDLTVSIFPTRLNDELSGRPDNIKLISFRFDLAK